MRDESEIATLHGTGGLLEAVTLESGERLPFYDQRGLRGVQHAHHQQDHDNGGERRAAGRDVAEALGRLRGATNTAKIASSTSQAVNADQ